MRALVLYESMFGNTHAIASSIADGLATGLDVTLTEISDAPRGLPDDVDVLVVGGPTHAFGLSRPSTRQDAAQQAGRDPDEVESGLREWLAGLGPVDRSVPAAAFDTRVRRPRVPGSAAHRAAAKLRRLGFATLDGPTTFWVGGTSGPILDGELERARQWGEQLAAGIASPHRSGAGHEPRQD